MVTAADPMTPDASFTSPLFTIDEHHCGVTEEYTCDDSRGRTENSKYRKQIDRKDRRDIKPSRRFGLERYRKQKGYNCRVEGRNATGRSTEHSAIDNAE